MKTIKGPGIFLAQFADDKSPFNSLDEIGQWASGLGFKGVQIPSWDSRLFNLETAAESQACLLYTSPSPRDQRGSRMPSSA